MRLELNAAKATKRFINVTQQHHGRFVYVVSINIGVSPFQSSRMLRKDATLLIIRQNKRHDDFCMLAEGTPVGDRKRNVKGLFNDRRRQRGFCIVLFFLILKIELM